MPYFVYTMASLSGTLYIGVTNNLLRRVYEHKNKLIDGFSKRYNCTKLVYFEEYKNVNEAIEREKMIKKWRREKKEDLIRYMNIHWKDLGTNL